MKMNREQMQAKISALLFTADDEQLTAAHKALTSKLEPRVLLNTKKTAELLEYHPETVKRLARSGKLPVIKQSARRLRFDRDAVLRFREGAA